jgi:hypothetical protein
VINEVRCPFAARTQAILIIPPTTSFGEADFSSKQQEPVSSVEIF